MLVEAHWICLKVLKHRVSMAATEKSDAKVITSLGRLKMLSPDCQTALDGFQIDLGASKRLCAIYSCKEAITKRTMSIGVV
jgi:hypothetical protein